MNLKFFLVTFMLFYGASAQNFKSIGIGSGTATYLGELNPYNAPLKSILGLSTRWNVGLSFSQTLNKKIYLISNISYIRVFGDDNLIKTNKSKGELNYLRNLHFRNDLKEFSLQANYIITPFTNWVRRPEYLFFVSAGLAFFEHSPKAKEPIIDLDIKNNWVDLRPLMTEGQPKQYAKWAYSLPIGIGITKKISNKSSLQFELIYRFTSTDYIDDVSTYFSNNNSPFTNRSAEIYAAYSKNNRSNWLLTYLNDQGYSTQFPNQISKQFRSGIPPFDVDGAQRGNPKVRDSYFTTKVSLIYHFKPKIICPKIL